MFNTILNACLAAMINLLANDPKAQENLHDEIEAGRDLEGFAQSFCDYYWDYIELICYKYRDDVDALPIIVNYLQSSGGVLSDYINCMMNADSRAFFLRNAMFLPVSTAFADHLKANFS
jgi:hypothetical protein